LKETTDIRLNNLAKQKELGIDLIPVGESSLYDHILDTSASFGIIPKRYNYTGGGVDLNTCFEVTRGSEDAVASEMTKWCNTKYHYIGPELNEPTPTLKTNRAVTYYNGAKEDFGIEVKPVLVSPVTDVSLAEAYEQSEF